MSVGQQELYMYTCDMPRAFMGPFGCGFTRGVGCICSFVTPAASSCGRGGGQSVGCGGVVFV